MKLPLLKRSIDIRGHRTSVSLEDAFWSELKEIAHSQRVPVRKLIAQIDDTRAKSPDKPQAFFVITGGL